MLEIGQDNAFRGRLLGVCPPSHHRRLISSHKVAAWTECQQVGAGPDLRHGELGGLKGRACGYRDAYRREASWSHGKQDVELR